MLDPHSRRRKAILCTEAELELLHSALGRYVEGGRDPEEGPAIDALGRKLRRALRDLRGLDEPRAEP
jgi:hypothetical protein